MPETAFKEMVKFNLKRTQAISLSLAFKFSPMKYLKLFLIVSASCTFHAQSYKTTFQRSSHGTVIENQDPIWLFGHESPGIKLGSYKIPVGKTT